MFKLQKLSVMSVNKVILVGNVGNDPDVRHLENDLSFARFSLATSERYKDKNGQRVDRTEWHNIVVWRGLAKVVEEYVKKGSKLYVEGKIQTRKYQDKENVEKYMTEIVVDNLQMLDRKSDGGHAGSTSEKVSEPANNQSYETTKDDDLPF